MCYRLRVSLVILGLCLAVPSHAALFTYNLVIDRPTDAPASAFLGFLGFYLDGPHNAATANVGTVLRDSSTNGISYAFSFSHRVDGTSIPGLNLSGSCAVPPGAFSQSSGCGGSPATVSTSRSVAPGDVVTPILTGTLGPHDTLLYTSGDLLSGGAAPPEFVGRTDSFQNTSDAPISFIALFGAGVPATDAHTTISSDFFALFMDENGDGGALTFSLMTAINGTIVPELSLAGSCSFGPGEALRIDSCPSGLVLSPLSAALTSGPAGPVEGRNDDTLSGGGTLGIIGGMRLFNTAATALPEPSSLLLIVLGLVLLGVRRCCE